MGRFERWIGVTSLHLRRGAGGHSVSRHCAIWSRLALLHLSQRSSLFSCSRSEQLSWRRYNRGGAWMFTRQSLGEWIPTWNFGGATPLSDTANPLESRAGHTVVRRTFTYETDLDLRSSVSVHPVSVSSSVEVLSGGCAGRGCKGRRRRWVSTSGQSASACTSSRGTATGTRRRR